MNYIVIFDVIIILLGIYLVYCALQMKKSGEIAALLIAREEIAKCKDKASFISKIYKKTAVFGMISILFGILGCVNDMAYSFGRFYDVASVMVYLMSWCWFSREVRIERGNYF